MHLINFILRIMKLNKETEKYKNSENRCQLAVVFCQSIIGRLILYFVKRKKKITEVGFLNL